MEAEFVEILGRAQKKNIFLIGDLHLKLYSQLIKIKKTNPTLINKIVVYDPEGEICFNAGYIQNVKRGIIHDFWEQIGMGLDEGTKEQRTDFLKEKLLDEDETEEIKDVLDDVINDYTVDIASNEYLRKWTDKLKSYSKDLYLTLKEGIEDVEYSRELPIAEGVKNFLIIIVGNKIIKLRLWFDVLDYIYSTQKLIIIESSKDRLSFNDLLIKTKENYSREIVKQTKKYTDYLLVIN